MKINNLDKHFTNHLEHHVDLEVAYERRLTTIETSRSMRVDHIEETIDKRRR